MTPANRPVDAHLGHDEHELPVKKVDGTVIHVRDVAYAHDGSPPQTKHRPGQPRKAVLMFDPECRLVLDVGHYRRCQGAAAQDRGRIARRTRPAHRGGSVALRQGRCHRCGSLRRHCGGVDRTDHLAVPPELALNQHHHGRNPARHSVFAHRTESDHDPRSSSVCRI
jgi:hypothetical protein